MSDIPLVRRKSNRLTGYDYSSCGTYFITVCIKDKKRLFGAPTVSTVINQLKGYVSKKVGFSLWQKLYYDHIIRDEEDYNTKWQYIDNNPATWYEKTEKSIEFKDEKGFDTMKLVIIFGNLAVGKMTVGQELAKITDLKLFHNHMTIEPVIEIFGYYDGKTVNRLRRVIFEEFSKSDNYGMIFTYVWALDHQGDWDYIKYVSDLFKEQGAEVYYVELVASQEIRLERNSTENRLNNKPSKRNLDFARKDLLDTDKKYRTESYDGEITFPNYIKIDNSHLSPNVVAQMIKERFLL